MLRERERERGGGDFLKAGNMAFCVLFFFVPLYYYYYYYCYYRS